MHSTLDPRPLPLPRRHGGAVATLLCAALAWCGAVAAGESGLAEEGVTPAMGGPAAVAVADGSTPLLEEVLRINRIQEPELDLVAARKAFAELVAAARPKVEAAKTPRETIAALNKVLLTDRNVSYLTNKYWRDATLAASLVRDKGNCLSTTTLYVVVGDALGLPIRMVDIPEHVFARWDDDEARINIETTAGGKEVADAHHEQRRPVTLADKERLGLYESLDEQGFLALLYAVAAKHRRDQNRLPEAKGLLRKALELRPDHLDYQFRLLGLEADLSKDRQAYRRGLLRFLMSKDPPPSLATSALVAMAQTYKAESDPLRERQWLLRAWRVAPPFEQEMVLTRLAFCHRALKDYRAALMYYELVVAKNPEKPDRLYNMAILQKNVGDLEGALATIRKARELNPESWNLQVIEAGYLCLAGKEEAGKALFATVQPPRASAEFFAIMTAWFYAVSKQEAKFFAAFEKALAGANSTSVLGWVKEDVDLDPYRDDPRFQHLLAEHTKRLLGQEQDEAAAGGSPKPASKTVGGAQPSKAKPAE